MRACRQIPFSNVVCVACTPAHESSWRDVWYVVLECNPLSSDQLLGEDVRGVRYHGLLHHVAVGLTQRTCVLVVCTCYHAWYCAKIMSYVHVYVVCLRSMCATAERALAPHACWRDE